MDFTRRSRPLAHLLCAAALCALGSMANAQSFTNSTPITINDNNAATPYPSTITVSGITAPIASISLTLNGFSHTFPDDVGVMLVGPTGAGQLIFNGGTFEDIVNANLTFADGGDEWPGSGTVGSGTYQPFSYYGGDTFSAPAPLIDGVNPTTTGEKSLSVFNGTDANGVWSLYVEDFVGGDSGIISGGWTLHVAPVPGPSALLVFGTGLIGLVGSRRLSLRKK